MRWFALILLLARPAWPAAPVEPAPTIGSHAVAATVAITAEYTVGTASIEDVHTWSVRWCETEGRTAKALAEHRERMVALQQHAATRVQAGMASPFETHAAAYFVAEADRWVTAGR